MENSVNAGFSNEQCVEDSEIVTLGDIIEEQELLADACAVLGASDDKNCTYAEGYLKRQAVYACLTCIPEARTDASKRAGICLACTFHCHDGHELVELYTKRNFRCDCGNSKFPNTCNLNNDKTDINPLNTYSQNFSGVYCTCARPYPDPEDPVMDEMIQCIICEDWYHSRHLGVEPPNHFAEMICESCVRENDFLLYYDGLAVVKVVNETNDKVDVGDGKGEEISTKDLLNKILNENENTNVFNLTEDIAEDPLKITEDPAGDTTENGDGAICKKPKIKSDVICTKFMKDISWRQQLCTCEECMNVYVNKNVTFLIDIQDTVQTYEEKGKALARENEMNALNSMDRVPLMEAIAGYNDMKGHLMEYLKKFAENKKVVREEDIREFFSSMDARKKQKTVIPYFCR